ncbi:MAG: transposase [Pseudomonadota bacterium]
MAHLSRYTHRVAISNSRLIRADARGVTFRVKNYRLEGHGRHTTTTLDTYEFTRRFLIHVPPKGQHRIRHYGFLGNGCRAGNIARIKDLLHASPPRSKQDRRDGSDTADDRPRTLALPCPHCSGRLIIVGSFPPGSQPRALPDHRTGA